MDSFMKKYKCPIEFILRWYSMYISNPTQELVNDDILAEVIDLYYKSLDDSDKSYKEVKTKVFCELLDCLEIVDQKFMNKNYD